VVSEHDDCGDGVGPTDPAADAVPPGDVVQAVAEFVDDLVDGPESADGD
jgi:hypothetical protein